MGVGQKMIAKLLGHSDTGATEWCTHVQVEQTKPLVETRWKRLARPIELRLFYQQ
jgi:site-specific recombinase XerD